MSIWGNDILVDPKISPLHKWAAKAVLKRADLVTCITRIQYNALLEYVPPSKVKILPFSVDCEVFKPGVKTDLPELSPASLKVKTAKTDSHDTIFSGGYLKLISINCHRQWLKK